MTQEISRPLVSLTRGERIFHVYVPLYSAGIIVVTLFSIVARDWSGKKIAAYGLLLTVLWAVFVISPLLILIAPPKKP